MTTVELKINGVLNNLSKGEKKAANYILQNVPKLLKLSLYELAAEADVNQATVIRLCKSLGYAGFKELRKSAVTEFNSIAFENRDSNQQYTDIKDKSSIESMKEYIS
ncbi:MAG: hypothetical protein RR444_11015, partial [Oscillospiraceae bacterium]